MSAKIPLTPSSIHEEHQVFLWVASVTLKFVLYLSYVLEFLY